MSRVVITGWQKGFQKISMTKLIRAYTDLDLAQGKRWTDNIVEGTTVTLHQPGGGQAERFIAEARELGAICHVEVEETALAVEVEVDR